MTKKNTRNLIHKSLIIIVLVFMLLTVFAPVLSVCAEEADLSLFERQSVDIDLKSFDIRNYGKDDNGSFQLFNFVEYCYSENLDIKNKYYGLYLYIYNPACEEILTLGNTISIAGKVINGKAQDYRKYPLILLSESKETDRLFYKFKVGEIETLNCGRTYDIGGMQINYKPLNGSSRIVDCKIGGRYVYSGYGAGCGSDPKMASSLTCEIKNTETIDLNLKQSSYLSGESSLGMGHRNQVSSVAFNVPRRFFRDYGDLQKITADWYEYRTEPILVTNNLEMYSQFSSTVNKPIKAGTTDYSYCEYGFEVGNSYDRITYSIFNRYNPNLTIGLTPIPKPMSSLYNVFYVDSSDISNYTVSRNSLISHLRSNVTENSDGFGVDGGFISRGVVNENVGLNRVSGHNVVTFDAGDSSIMVSNENHSIDAWTRFWSLFDKDLIKYDTLTTVAPIYILNSKDMSSTNEVISSGLLWGLEEVPDLIDMYRSGIAQNAQTVVFRFAVTDYYSELASVSKKGGFLNSADKTHMLTFTEQNVFLDFDIISLTFKRDGVYTEIATVSNPIDVVGPIEPPLDLDKDSEPDNWLDELLSKIGAFFAELWAKVKAFFSNGSNWWKWVLIGLAVLIGLPLVIALLPLIIKFVVALCKGLWYVIKYVSIGLWWLISAPFKLIIKWVRSICERRG